MTPAKLVLIAILITAWLPVTHAQERMGIAFVRAPEQASGVCTGPSPDEAFACAQRKCIAAGAAEKDCLRTAWCYPAGWSAVVLMLHNEGVHWHEVVCGWPTKASVLKAASLRCDDKERPFIVDCKIVDLLDELGRSQLN